MKLVYAPLAQEVIDRLVARADRNRRRPQDEAALIIERALRERRPKELVDATTDEE